MARRYDSRTTTFSPEGRLYQVEYAMEAINNASATIGIKGKDCLVVAADKPAAPKLLDTTRTKEKVFKIDNHIVCAAAGWTADAELLIEQARVTAQRYSFAFNEPQPLKNLVIQICDLKQSYTQFGGLRPFGVSFLFAGHDKTSGFQLYHTDPAGNFTGWKATAVGQNNHSAQGVLKQDWVEDMPRPEVVALAVKALSKTVDALRPGTLEICVLTEDGAEFLSGEEITAEIDRLDQNQ
ncbi:MAG: uncharacterized protein KVP18_004335 [Porospora cf. gigantea A]|uniref:uncharacterized protein n=1 Tax=Porospora cf. gigantea A TaxID=2853593 RepID=UPI00355ABA69|nr:MAG: hypothetical protein KVP18_004335 [Porospora cf. gigantea A]